MLFNSYEFALLMLAFVPAFLVLRRHLAGRNLLILATSYVFYGAWDERFLILLVASTAIDYTAALLIERGGVARRQAIGAVAFLLGMGLVCTVPTWTDSAWIMGWVVGLAIGGPAYAYGLVALVPARHRRRAVLLSCLALNLGILGFFKYFNFFADSFADAMGTLGVAVSPVVLHVVLPVGISFYTFQSMSYTIDAYRGQVRAEPDLVRFAAYVAFFPQLVAGPIERAQALLPQFSRVLPVEGEALRSGAVLFLWGLYKKVVIADNLAPIADVAFGAGDPGALGGSVLLAGLVAFTFQIYCDFSGYSDMARGLARMMGFELMLNFNLPYFARTPSEFWQRWHISLSTWLRDYLYVPLGGNRLGPWRTYRNLVLTMLLGGLWHGANWTFVLWGAYHGLLLVAYRALGVDAALARARDLPPALSLARDAALVGVMFSFTMGGWLLFRIGSVPALLSYLEGLASWSAPPSEHWGAIAVLVLPLLAVQVAQRAMGRLEIFPALPAFVRLNVAVVFLCGVLFGASTGTPFIYFDF